MVEDDLDEFRMYMMELTECYPNQRFSDGNVHSYFRKLMKYPMEIVLRSLRRAPDEYPDRMPTAGQLAAMCKASGSSAARDTTEYLKRTFGDSYYERDYEDGIARGINRPVVDVLRDEVDRGWRDNSELERYMWAHPFGGSPREEKVSSSRRCEALAKEWAKTATGETLSQEENHNRLKALMRAYAEDQQEAREKKYIDTSGG